MEIDVRTLAQVKELAELLNDISRDYRIPLNIRVEIINKVNAISNK